MFDFLPIMQTAATDFVYAALVTPASAIGYPYKPEWNKIVSFLMQKYLPNNVNAKITILHNKYGNLVFF